MELWTAFLLGLVGSAHCAGMCGPLAIALPSAGGTAFGQFAGRIAYNTGRVFTYMLMGAVFGLVGRGFAMAGVQRWVSLTLGIIMLAGLFASSGATFGVPMSRAVGWMKGWFGALLRQRSIASLVVIGMLNGLLPCGLVYAACAAATTRDGAWNGTIYMAAFGLGTVPMMLGLAMAGAALQFRLRLRLQRLIPVSLAVVGVLLVLRGLALGIPYLSPDVAGAAGASCCVPPH